MSKMTSGKHPWFISLMMTIVSFLVLLTMLLIPGAASQNITCFDFADTSPFVCSGHGNCTSLDKCDCSKGWTGAHCSIPVCNGLGADLRQSCGNFTCVAPDTCECVSRATWGQDECRDFVYSPPIQPICIDDAKSGENLVAFLHTTKDIPVEHEPKFVWANGTRVAFAFKNEFLRFFSGVGSADFTQRGSLLSESINHYSTYKDTRSNTLFSSLKSTDHVQYEAFSIDYLFTGGSIPFLGRYRMKNVQDFVPARMFDSKQLAFATLSNPDIAQNIQFDTCSPTSIPSILREKNSKVVMIAVLELAINFCVNRTLSYILTDTSSTHTESNVSVIAYSSGVVIRSYLDGVKLLLKRFESYELFSSVDGYVTYDDVPIVSDDYRAHVTIDERNEIILVGTSYYPLKRSAAVPSRRAIPFFQELNCSNSFGHSTEQQVRSFHSQGFNYFFVSKECKNTTDGSERNLLVKLDGIHVVWSFEIELPLPFIMLLDFYVDSIFHRYHLLLGSSFSQQALYYVVKSDKCKFIEGSSDYGNDKGISREKLVAVIFVAVLFIGGLLFFILCGSSFLCYKKRKQKRKDDMLHARLLDLELTSRGDDDSNGSNLSTATKIGINELTFKSKVSEGAYGAVFRGTWYNQDVAIKRLKVDDEDAFVREVSVLNSLRHPNVLMLYGYSVDGRGDKYIITEFVDGGNLETALTSGKLGSIASKIEALLGIAQGMTFLHSRENKIVHRDLKPQNVLMKKDSTCKLCDFGLSKIADESLTVGVSFGTLQYMCPELLQQDIYDEKCDVYSFGIMMHEVFTLQRPYMSTSKSGLAHQNQFTIGLKVIQGLRPTIPETVTQFDPEHPQNCEQISEYFLQSNEVGSLKLSHNQIASIVSQYFSLCVACWSHNAQDRPSFDEVVHRLMSIQQCFDEKTQ